MRIDGELMEIWPNEVCDSCFIRDFSTIARPLFDLTYSDQAWNWDAKEQEAFKGLKMAVTTALVLVLP